MLSFTMERFKTVPDTATGKALAGLLTELRGLGTKEKNEPPPLRVKRAENFPRLENNCGKLLLTYFMRPPDNEALGVIRP